MSKKTRIFIQRYSIACVGNSYCVMISSKLNMLRCFKPNQVLRILNQKQLHLSRPFYEHTKVETNDDKIEKEKSESEIETGSKSPAVAKAFASISNLKPSKHFPWKKKKIDPVETIISNAKDVETLLSAIDTSIVSRKHALKVLSTLTDWSSNDKIKLQDFESDTRFIKICRVLGRPVKSSNEPETLGDLSVVLGVTGDDEAAKLISSIQLPQMIKILSALGSKKKRSTPLLRSLAFNIGRSSERLDIKQGADVFYATAVLNFPDEVLLEKVCADICEAIPTNEKPAVIGSLSTSIGLLRYHNSEILEQISHWIEKNYDVCRVQDVISFVLALARVNYTPNNHEQLFSKVIPSLTPAEVGNASIWVDVVWSYLVLGHFLVEHVQSVLSSQFVQQFSESGVESTGVKLKLININAAAKHIVPSYSGPFLDASSNLLNIPLSKSREKQALVSVLTDSLVNLVPAQTHLKSNVDIGLGFLIDAEFYLDSKKNPVPLDKSKDAHKIAVLTMDYHDLCRGTHNHPNGINALGVRLLEKVGYHVIVVPYTEFNRKDKLVTRVKYLEDKIKQLKIE